MPYDLNLLEFWNLKKLKAPPLSAYINNRDSTKDIEEKSLWYRTKCATPIFDLNYVLVKYCSNDSRLLLSASVRFIQQTFEMGKLLICQFGRSPAWTSPIFCTFNKNICMLGSLRYLSFHKLHAVQNTESR